MTEARTPASRDQSHTVHVVLNGTQVKAPVEPSLSLLDLVRSLGATSAHPGCEHGVCGACTVLLDGDPVRSCVVLAVQANGCTVETVESLGNEITPHPLQIALSQSYGLQCGYCTPGFVMLALGYLKDNPSPSLDEIRELVSGNICRCTGYRPIVEAIANYAAAAALDHTGEGLDTI